MEKLEIRKEFFKLKNKGHSYLQCRKILKTQFNFEATKRTLIRWNQKLMGTEWNLLNKSRKPKTIHYKTTDDIKQKIISIRDKTNWGKNGISDEIGIG